MPQQHSTRRVHLGQARHATGPIGGNVVVRVAGRGIRVHLGALVVQQAQGLQHILIREGISALIVRGLTITVICREKPCSHSAATAAAVTAISAVSVIMSVDTGRSTFLKGRASLGVGVFRRPMRVHEVVGGKQLHESGGDREGRVMALKILLSKQVAVLLAVVSHAAVLNLADCHSLGEEKGNKRFDRTVVDTIPHFPESSVNENNDRNRLW